MTALRVVLVGAGRAGMVHGRNFAAGVPGATLIGVADPDRQAREAAAHELGVDRAFADPSEAVTDDRVDAVVIGAPTFTHADTAVAALKAGKHVLCEKPMATTLDEAHAMADAAEQSSAVFLMAFMRRFDAGFRRAAERIAAGDIGKPVLVRSTGRGPGLPPEWAWDTSVSGGLVAEVNSHDIDTIRWLSGQEPTRVFAVGRAAKRPDLAERYPGFVDTLVATLELSDGAMGQFDGACPADYGYDARVEVYGTEGTVLVGGPTSGPLLVRAGGGEVDPVRSWRTLFADAYREEDRHFVAVARGEEAPLTGASDGVRALATVAAANRSMATGQPVALAEVLPA
ncbi:Gfo/Idh/MocA family oxidoreductase [Egicoccus sp. AB-alg2]|uniref:Gfo/Idh/MocA family oxidoreductase n=1 Tax=Egicoccus sp. AB-alg2 TaxID=3242693 RepID=UPI00359E88E1